MTNTFNVGDEVQVLSGGTGIVKYGPVNSTFGSHKIYVVAQDGDAERAFKAADLAPLPKFAVGDTVEYTIGDPVRGTLVAGPFRSEYHDDPIWVVEKTNGTHMTPTQRGLRKVTTPEPIKVGDRVRVVRAKYAEHCHGKVGVVTSTTSGWRSWTGDRHPYIVRLDDGSTLNVAEVERLDEPAADTYKYGGVVYDLSAEYRDKDGDVWRFERRPDGTVRGAWTRRAIDNYDETLGSVVDSYGPLTRVND